jgi:hypothetical protein
MTMLQNQQETKLNEIRNWFGIWQLRRLETEVNYLSKSQHYVERGCRHGTLLRVIDKNSIKTEEEGGDKLSNS